MSQLTAFSHPRRVSSNVGGHQQQRIQGSREPLRVQDVDVEPPHPDESNKFLQTITLFFIKND